MRDSGENFGEIAFESDEDRLRFGVAEADVVFEHARARGGEHETDEEDAAKVELVSLRACERRLDDLADDALERRSIEHVGRGDRPHAAGVRPLVAFADAFVVAKATRVRTPAAW